MRKCSIVKVLTIITILLIIILSANSCFAISDVTNSSSLNTWKPTAQSSNSLSNKVGGILGAITVIGTIVSVGSLSIIGIKTMLGTLEERANYKQKMVPWLIGAIMLFAVTTLPTIIYNVATGIF